MALGSFFSEVKNKPHVSNVSVTVNCSKTFLIHTILQIILKGLLICNVMSNFIVLNPHHGTDSKTLEPQ